MPPGQDDYEDNWDNGNDNEDMNDESLTSHEASDAALAVAVKLDSSWASNISILILSKLDTMCKHCVAIISLMIPLLYNMRGTPTCESCPDASSTVADLSFWVSLFCILVFDNTLRPDSHLGGNS